MFFTRGLFPTIPTHPPKMDTFDFSGCQDVSFHLGTKCNFQCGYCDRKYITKIGNQSFTLDDVPALITFLRDTGLFTNPPKMFSFHGGEPLVFVDVMDQLISSISINTSSPVQFFIQTNGSLIQRNEKFFKRWGKLLRVSISYDFLYQPINRTEFDIHEALTILNNAGIKDVQLQYVMPITDPQVFSLNTIKAIVAMFNQHSISNIVLIPLRHHRGADNFKVLINDLDLPLFFAAFLRFIHVLYTYGVDVVVDGQGTGIDKHYFNQHKQLILSPDGLIYPEYDFLEYKWTHTSIGSWKPPIKLNRIKNDDDMLLPDCVSCSSRPTCGLKYLFKGFNEPRTSDKCKQFYEMLNVIILHSQKLKTQKTFFHWVGI